MKDDISRVLISKAEIAERVREIAAQINSDFRDEKLIVVCILRGSCYFFTDLTRELDNYIDLEFMSVSSYASGTSSSGEVRIIKDIDCAIEGKNVIIVEDIVDTGYTLSYLKRILLERRPKCLKICALLDKPSRRKTDINADYVGFEVPNEFVIGYGLDYAQNYRNLPYIAVLKEEIYG